MEFFMVLEQNQFSAISDIQFFISLYFQRQRKKTVVKERETKLEKKIKIREKRFK